MSAWTSDPGAIATLRICKTVVRSPRASATDAAAAEVARAAMDRHRDDADVLFAIARMCVVIGDLDLAEAALRLAWESEVDDARVVQMYGEICLHRQDRAGAEWAFEYMGQLRRRESDRPLPMESGIFPPRPFIGELREP